MGPELEVGREPLLERVQAQVGEPPAGGVGEGLRSELGERGPAPERQRLAKELDAPRGIRRLAGQLRQHLEPGQIDILRGRREEITGRPSLDCFRSECLPQLRDVALEHLRGAPRWRFAPEVFDQALGRNDSSGVEQQPPEQGTRLAARQRDGLPVLDGLERPEQAKPAHRFAGIMAPVIETAVSPGRTIGRFRLEALIGEGATGLVFRAAAGDGRVVAVKQLRPELLENGAALARFRREALLVRSITTPHLAPILELGEVDGLVFLVQPYYEGGSLAARLRSEGRLDPATSCRLAAQVARGLDALHERGVLHRDVKPSNVLLDGAGAAALADFGLARTAESTRLTAEGQILGTPHYLAPELIEGREAGRPSDVYSLGCIVYECLVGEPPFAGRAAAEIGYAHLVEAPPDPRGRRSELPGGLADAVLASLEKEPAARPTTATALARMLHVGCSSPPA